MSEIKTCEQYVLFKLQELEYENEQLKIEQEHHTELLQESLSLFKILKNYASVSAFGPDKKKYLNIEINGYDDEADDFKTICKALQISEESEEDASISD